MAAILLIMGEGSDKGARLSTLRGGADRDEGSAST
jgi:hypothetical protein